MATYNVQRSRTGLGVAIPDAASPDTQTDLHLVGQNAVSYGLDVAQSFFFLLENFATEGTPPATPQVGQLYYDMSVGSLALQVWNGAAWDVMAPVDLGVSADSMSRWDDTAQTWVENTHLTLSAAGVLTLKDSTDADTIVFTKVTSGALTIAAGTGTLTDVTFSGLTGDLTVTGGRGLSVEDAGTAVAFRAASGSSSLEITAASTTDINLPSGATLNTAASGAARAGINIAEGTAPSSPADGDVWVTAAGEFFARLNGVSTDLSAASGTVTSSGSPLADEVAVFTTGTNLDSDATFTWDGTTMFATNVTGTNIGGIASANLISRIAPGTISGAATFSNATPITATAGDISATGGNGFTAVNGASAVAIRSTGGDTAITHSSTTDFLITGVGGIFSVDAPIHATSGGAESFRIIGDAATWATADSYISFYDSDASDFGLQIGTIVADSSNARINARLGGLDLYASNTLAAAITANTTTWTSNSITSLVLRNAFLTGTDATTSATVADHNDNQHNVGYNETPLADDVGGNINTGSFTLGALSIGKFISRTTGTSRTLTLDNDTDIPVGGSVVVHNGNSGGTFTIAIGTITNLNWIDGSGTLPTPTVNRTLSNNSVVTLRKVNATDWQIWGNGIT